jgi:tRNA A37 threonylcarbamoyladenosine synthetase subunit TsaC/SUA5/YrdC
MANLSRKSFIGKASASAVAAGALVAIPTYTLGADAAQASAAEAKTTAHTGPVLAHVRNVETGEIAIFSGTREIVIHDIATARRLIQAAQ